MSKEKPFGWCFIGCGTLARKVAEQITASGKHRIVSVYTRRPEACQAFAEQFGGAACASAEEAVAAEGVEGVYVVTPHNRHAHYTEIALRHDRPVLCEKAFTVNRQEADRLISLARERRVYLAEAMWTWFSPIARQVREWVTGGVFGEVLSCDVDMRTDAMHYAPRVTDPAAAGGALLDVGVYGICYVYKLFGLPSGITCTGRLERGIDWSDEIVLEYPGGRNYRIVASVCDRGVTTSLTLRGTHGSMILPEYHYAGHAECTDADGRKLEISGDGSYLNEFTLAAEEIRAGQQESRYMPLEDTRNVMNIMDECRRKMGLKYDFE